jgi:hypothetical protein
VFSKNGVNSAASARLAARVPKFRSTGTTTLEICPSRGHFSWRKSWRRLFDGVCEFVVRGRRDQVACVHLCTSTTRLLFGLSTVRCMPVSHGSTLEVSHCNTRAAVRPNLGKNRTGPRNSKVDGRQCPRPTSQPYHLILLPDHYFLIEAHLFPKATFLCHMQYDRSFTILSFPRAVRARLARLRESDGHIIGQTSTRRASPEL